MRHRGVHTSPFPIHLLFADACLVGLPVRAGLDLDDALRLGCAPYPIVVGSLCGYS